MSITDINGKPIVILTVEEAIYIKEHLTLYGEIGPQIIKKCDEVIAFEINKLINKMNRK